MSENLRSEQEQRLRRALAELDELQRELIRRRLMDCSWAEIANDLGFETADAAHGAFAQASLDLARALGALDE